MDRYFENQARQKHDHGLEEYFVNQAGSGIDPFEGYQYQGPVNLRGHGFFGRIISSNIMPLLRKVLPFLGRTALSAAGDLASDFSSGTSFKDALKQTAKKTASTLARKAADKLDQGGTGTMNAGLRKIFENRRKARRVGRKTIKRKKKAKKRATPRRSKRKVPSNLMF